MRSYCFTALCALLVTTAPGHASGEDAGLECPDDPAIAQVQAEPIYSDAQGSVIDTGKLRRHKQEIEALRNFVTDASRRADSAVPGERACALHMMIGWADARAMQQRPSDFGGLRELERFTISLNIIALKLRAGGLNIDPLLSWLGGLDRAVIDGFGKRDRVDNLYAWSGVAAASFALLSGDHDAQKFENSVWNETTGAIRPDGFVDSELRRGSRALIYHVYALSAILTLRAFRSALGERTNANERVSLKRLVGRVAGSLCDPVEIDAASGSTPQAPTPVIELAPIIVFAGDLSDPRFRTCGPRDIPPSDPILGGNLVATASMLAAFRPAH